MIGTKKTHIHNYVIYNKIGHYDRLIKVNHPIEQQEKKYNTLKMKQKDKTYILCALLCECMSYRFCKDTLVAPTFSCQNWKPPEILRSCSQQELISKIRSKETKWWFCTMIHIFNCSCWEIRLVSDVIIMKTFADIFL